MPGNFDVLWTLVALVPLVFVALLYVFVSESLFNLPTALAY